MKKIRMEMARNESFPNGSAKHGYEIVAPLDDSNHLDAEGWRKNRDRCRVVRFWGNEEHQLGHLIHKQGGSWAFHYDIRGDENADDRGYNFQSEPFVPGEYISIKEADGDEMIYQIISVIDVPD